MAKREQISVPVDAELRRQIEAAALADERSTANWVRHALGRVLADQTEQARAQQQAA